MHRVRAGAARGGGLRDAAVREGPGAAEPRLRGSPGGDAPPLLLQGHVDVVTTAGQRWTHPPFGGELVDGYVWGRGALDMKGGVAMLVHAFLRAKREGVALPGDLVLVVLADEEAGGDFGAGFLAEEHPELFDGIRYSLGEFGGFTLHDRRQALLSDPGRGEADLLAQGDRARPRRPRRVSSTAGGTVARLGKLLRDLDRKRTPVHVTPVVREFVERIAAELPRKEAAVMRSLLKPRLTDTALRLLGDRAATTEPMLRNTVNATIVRGEREDQRRPERDRGRARRARAARLRARPADRGGAGDRRRRRRARARPPRPGPARARPRPLRDARRRDPRARPGGHPGAAAPDRRHRRAASSAASGSQNYGFLPMRLPDDCFALLHAADERPGERSSSAPSVCRASEVP